MKQQQTRAAQPANLHLPLLDKAGVHLDSFADNNGKVDELFEPLSAKLRVNEH